MSRPPIRPRLKHQLSGLYASAASQPVAPKGLDDAWQRLQGRLTALEEACGAYYGNGASCNPGRLVLCARDLALEALALAERFEHRAYWPKEAQ